MSAKDEGAMFTIIEEPSIERVDIARLWRIRFSRKP